MTEEYGHFRKSQKDGKIELYVDSTLLPHKTVVYLCQEWSVQFWYLYLKKGTLVQGRLSKITAVNRS